jgi:uncharacterized repeat protein (TIGR01451 family)
MMAATTLVAGVVVGFVSGPGAADFVSECATPTLVVNGNSVPSLTLAPGDVVLIGSGTFTGGVNALPTGATLCVAAGASFVPAYLNNGAGRFLNNGTSTFNGVASATGASVENAGRLDFPLGFNNNGALSVLNKATGVITVDTPMVLSTGATITNLGSVTISGALTLKSGTNVANSGTLTVDSLTVGGRLTNDGTLNATGAVTVDASSTWVNLCRMGSASFTNNSPDASNDGVMRAGVVTNNGTFRQSTTGVIAGVDFTNAATVGGAGGYSFSGTTRTQSVFSGDSPDQPIIVADTTPTVGQIFDEQSGTVTNTVRGNVAVPAATVLAPDCLGGAGTPSTNISASVLGPSTVGAGTTITYTVAVTNLSRTVDAADVVVTDALPPQLVSVVTSPPGTLVGSTLTWDLGTLFAGATNYLIIRATTPAGGTLTNSVSATTATPDGDPTNNNGTQANATVTSTVVAQVPANQPPAVSNQSVATTANLATTGFLAAVDNDAGQTVTFGVTTRPAHGQAVVQANGAFAYQPAIGFTGIDSFVATGCDNGTPPRCDTGVVTVTVSPVALPDERSTTVDTPVTIPVKANDIGVTSPPVLVGGAARGTTRVTAAEEVTYTPATGFVGTDRFTYRVCSPTSPSVCASAVVTVHVTQPIVAPQVGNDSRATAMDTPVDGVVTMADSTPGALEAKVGALPLHGTADVRTDGSYTYTPESGFSGPDTFTIIGCNIATLLCSTGIVTIDVLGSSPSPTPSGTPTAVPTTTPPVGASATSTPPGATTTTRPATPVGALTSSSPTLPITSGPAALTLLPISALLIVFGVLFVVIAARRRTEE